MEVNEGKVSEVGDVVKFSETEACTGGQDKEECDSGSDIHCGFRVGENRGGYCGIGEGNSEVVL